MKLVAINGSPRKNWNTAQLMGKVVEGARSGGAEAELVHLRDLDYSGCISCFACKRIGGPSYGRCAVRDGLTHLLDLCHEADCLALGTPFYFGMESAFMRAFLERLWFQYSLYSTVKAPLAPKKNSCALVYTMNVPREMMEYYHKDKVVEGAKGTMEHLFGPCRVLLSCDTLQFDDYSLYDSDRFDAGAKQKRHAEIFPQELDEAFNLGISLVS